MNIKLSIASIFTVFVILFSWKITYSYHCLALVFPLILLAIIAWSLIEIKKYQKKCFRDCYLKEDSLLARFVISKTITMIFYLLASIAMTMSIMHSIIDYPKELWGYIGLHAIIIVIIFNLFNKLLINSIHAKYLPLFSREMTINTMLLLLPVYIYIVFNSYEPIYLRETWRETIEIATNSIYSQCYMVDYILKLKTELDALFWWSVIYTSDNTGNNIFKYSIWIAFIIINGLAILGINRFIVQIVYILNIKFNAKDENYEE